MATNQYVSKTWKNTIAQYPNRRTITDISSGTKQTVEVVRAIGTISQEGDAWNASNMNDMEGRINFAFATAFNQLGGLSLVPLTQAEYDNLGVYPETTLFVITEGELNDPPVHRSTYGVEVDFASKKIIRIAGSENFTAGADFDALTPWGGRRRCNLSDDGVVLAYRGETGYTEAGATTVEIKKTVDGVEKTYERGTKVQVMVEQPIFYVKAVPVKAKNATSGKGKQYVKARFYISPTPKSGFVAPRAFYDNNGILQDKIYLSAYEGSIYDTSAAAQLLNDEQVADFATDMFCSIAGAKPASGLTQNLTRANVRKLCNNRGAGWMSHNIFAMAVTEWLLMVEYASLDPQRKVGQGVSTFTDDGSTNMAVVTGATAGIGNGSGIPDGGEDGKCSVTYRGEENLWGNIWTWLDCINILAEGVNEVWVTKIGTTPKDDTTEGYECLDAHATHSGGYISAFGIDPDHPELLIPTEASGSDTFADYVWENHNYNGFLIAMLGGKWSSGSRCGLCLSLGHASSDRSRTFGGRLLYVP